VPPVVTIGSGQVDAVLNKDTNLLRWKLSYSATLTALQVADLMVGRWYANIHRAQNPGGEIRGKMTMR
jgi:hypothetical protein